MDQDQTRELMERMTREQPFIQLYVAAICERGDFSDESDTDAFANLATIVWHAMDKAAPGPLQRVSGGQLDECEENLMRMLEYAEGESEDDLPAFVNAWMDDYPQPHLLEFLLETLFSPENPYEVTPEAAGMLFTYLKIIIDSLDKAAPDEF
jgi:hypothetical protein